MNNMYIYSIYVHIYLYIHILNEYRALVEWYRRGTTKVLGEKRPVPVPICPQKLSTERPGTEPGPPRRQAGN